MRGRDKQTRRGGARGGGIARGTIGQGRIAPPPFFVCAGCGAGRSISWREASRLVPARAATSLMQARSGGWIDRRLPALSAAMLQYLDAAKAARDS
jgi:hypothetical protein